MSTIVIGRNVRNIFTQINSTCSVLCISSDNYEFKTIIDTKYIEFLKNFIWYRLNTDDGNYFASTLNARTRDLLPETMKNFNQILLHRLVAHIAYQNPNNHPTVDHINRQTLDNRHVNLRWLSQSNQNRNTDKRKRKINARPLPDDIEGPLPKYITWNLSVETTKTGKVLERKFFRIEKHPAQNEKTWTTTKASTVSNQDKLNQALEKLSEFDKLLEPEDPLREQLLKEYNELITV
jgi:hypothetical protein